ncbi:4-aminobutyrate--2-oxoglutarate transaminase [Marinobacter lutaoensis]|jgi:4-aminobutyrate aminotransferase/(S)-3-amino-2-methylpropionate transaminase|uniref:4-aminobutyrate transaminase n=1 Tax=Marinobacter lutaoensis TaxID=135739 RepID=A0A1V2DUD2_9GAMM|nr:4-aminobutyrate--2-oxoglutarate transaminase [Marinobacter lutaoensis]MBI43367.1 4-aminobutyrate--2-oxoglutarate transaminase [Oceanospirillales bacterium]ONF44314.1 4-aminobutyrate transaminase [Marinobacter lutaoensis]|tara:strand:- start:519 stop:1796 length:1278 start_codon:yes stop_codon:yes gene_type:complete
MTNEHLQQRKEAVIARGMGNLAPIYVDRARNAELWDVEGKRYIDFGAGIAVVNTGHCHPKVIAAVRNQLDKVTHSCLTVTPYAVAVELAERLVRIAPGPSAKKAMFASTGAEAVENAVKIARAHTGRRAIVAFDGGFHGRTNLTLGLTGKVAPYKAGFGPFPGDLYRLPYPNAYHGVSDDQVFEALRMRFKTDIEPDQVAAVVIEPVQGEGGFYRAPVEFLQRLRALCDEHGILLICDEIQTGFARTGKMFALEYAGIEADIMTMAKGIAGGFPLSAVVGKAEIMDAANPGGLGGTYGGSPIACAAGLAVLAVIEEERLCQRALAVGERIGGRLRELQARHPEIIGDVRQLGAMVAVEFVHDGQASRPNTELPKTLAAEAVGRGLILLTCGIRSNVIRFLPALTAPLEVVDEGMAIFAELLAEHG